MNIFVAATVLIALCLPSFASAQTADQRSVRTCAIAVVTPQGWEICVKTDGEVDLPKGLEISVAARAFWTELARVYPFNACWMNEAKLWQECINGTCVQSK